MRIMLLKIIDDNASPVVGLAVVCLAYSVLCVALSSGHALLAF